LVLGITFKENCPDIRNSRVIDIIEELQSYHVNVDVYDPWASAEEVKHEYNLDLKSSMDYLQSDYDAIILAVSHNEFLELSIDNLKSDKCVVFDVKSLLPINSVDARL
jgi:UDP-N-acetyl-D-galactosamine dehydrogenase